MSKDSKSNYQKIEVDLKKYDIPNLEVIGKIHGIFQRVDGTSGKIVVGANGAIGLDGKEKKKVKTKVQPVIVVKPTKMEGISVKKKVKDKPKFKL